jgi:hypothetical protein
MEDFLCRKRKSNDWRYWNVLFLGAAEAYHLEVIPAPGTFSGQVLVNSTKTF